jgi:hypothetical protein
MIQPECRRYAVVAIIAQPRSHVFECNERQNKSEVEFEKPQRVDGTCLPPSLKPKARTEPKFTPLCTFTQLHHRNGQLPCGAYLACLRLLA